MHTHRYIYIYIYIHTRFEPTPLTRLQEATNLMSLNLAALRQSKDNVLVNALELCYKKKQDIIPKSSKVEGKREFQKLGLPYFGGPYNKDPTI